MGRLEGEVLFWWVEDGRCARASYFFFLFSLQELHARSESAKPRRWGLTYLGTQVIRISPGYRANDLGMRLVSLAVQATD